MFTTRVFWKKHRVNYTWFLTCRSIFGRREFQTLLNIERTSSLSFLQQTRIFSSHLIYRTRFITWQLWEVWCTAVSVVAASLAIVCFQLLHNLGEAIEKYQSSDKQKKELRRFPPQWERRSSDPQSTMNWRGHKSELWRCFRTKLLSTIVRDPRKLQSYSDTPQESMKGSCKWNWSNPMTFGYQ